MDITSLSITFVGIIFISVLYIISRMTRSKLPQIKARNLPRLKNEDGTLFTSILDDIPASDDLSFNSKAEPYIASNQKTGKDLKQQHILFISGNDDAGLDGNLISKVLKKNGLILGDFDVYHYLVKANTINENNEKITSKLSLFQVANGIDPWTLKDEDLHNQKLAGLSIILVTPSAIDDTEAIKLFISISHKISKEINGVLKNQQQQLFTPKDEKALLKKI